MTQSIRTLLLCTVAAAVALGACSPSPREEASTQTRSPATKTVEKGESQNLELREEVATLFARFDREYDVLRVGEDISLEIQGARIRGIDNYEYSILKFGIPAFDLEKLRSGQLPYYAQGDFDCDEKEDRAVLLDAPESMLVMSLGKGATLAFPEYDGDTLDKGSKGTYLTLAGQGSGTSSPEEPKRFESPCDFVVVHWWLKSSYAVVYDPESGTFAQFWMSD